MTQPTLAFVTQQVGASDNALRTGTVIRVGYTTGRLGVDIGGQVLDLNRLAGVALPAVGATVAVLRQDSTWLVLGEVANGSPLDAWVEVPQTAVTPSGARWVSITGTNPVINNGQMRMRYRRADLAGQRYEVECYLKGGSTTNWGTGVYGWSAPFRMTPDSVLMSTGSGHILNLGVQEYVATPKVYDVNTIRMFWAGVGGGGNVAQTSPFAFGQDDEIRFSIFVDRAA